MVGERLWTDLRDGTRWAVTWRQVDAQAKSGTGGHALTFLSREGTNFQVVVPAAVTSRIDTLTDTEFRAWLAKARVGAALH